MSILSINDMTYNLLKKSLDTSSLRQQTISNNISNINTPNYKSSKVVFEEKLNRALGKGKVSLRATKSNHIGIHNNISNIEPSVVKNTNTKMNKNGNNVDIDLEMVNLSANQILYNTLIQQTNKKISTLRYVISEGKR